MVLSQISDGYARRLTNTIRVFRFVSEHDACGDAWRSSPSSLEGFVSLTPLKMFAVLRTHHLSRDE